MSQHQPGSIYKVGGRRYVDSQAVYNFAQRHEIVAEHDGWRIMVPGGAVLCARVEDPADLPGQRGSLYQLSADPGISLKAQSSAWMSQGLVQAGGTFETSAAAKTSCGGCGKTCGCGPCRLKHGHDHS
ncbi:hypothetical protein OV079_02435 [Nannocystis pusilla]|uniref:Uncharacterized protein n=1 Tax=Nannocystis pusilla TaxID=889268 RepID=A0A9X3ES73_9BACT|nr:hypothetical protein [Nannocystis pusilla]MCY1004443.1 hypothetical protein [Nannocystis pusilla]